MLYMNQDYVMGLYLTHESILKNFSTIFQVFNETLATRFYLFLSKGYKMKRIYADDYFVRLYGLTNGGFIERN